MSNQTFINLGPYRDVIHRHRASFYSTLVAGMAITALALVVIPKEYTSQVVLEVWHADIQQNLIGAEPENGPATTHLDQRLEALSEETITHEHLQQLIAKHGLYLRDGKPSLGAIGQMAEAISITIPETVLQSKTPNRWQKLLPPDAIAISFQYPDPAKAQAVANDLGDIMSNEYRKELERHNEETIKLLSKELDETRSKLAESQSQIKVLKEKYRGSLPQDLSDNVKAVEALQMQLEHSAESEDNKADATQGSSSDAPKANTPEAELAALQAKLVALRAQYSDEYPEVIETKSQIAILQTQVGKPDQQPATASQPRDTMSGAIQQRIAEYQKAIAETPAHEEAIAAVNRDYGILSNRYNDLSNLFFEARADQAVLERGQAERAQLLQRAPLPTPPS